jgi:hypothetical protein
VISFFGYRTTDQAIDRVKRSLEVTSEDALEAVVDYS